MNYLQEHLGVFQDCLLDGGLLHHWRLFELAVVVLDHSIVLWKLESGRLCIWPATLLNSDTHRTVTVQSMTGRATKAWTARSNLSKHKYRSCHGVGQKNTVLNIAHETVGISKQRHNCVHVLTASVSPGNCRVSMALSSVENSGRSSEQGKIRSFGE